MELKNNDYEDDFKKVEQYKRKLDELDSGINLLLDEFKKLYVIKNMHPTNDEYSNQYDMVINNLSSILSKLFGVSNDLQLNIDKVNKNLLELDILIKKERNENKELKRKLGIIENQNNAASEMINDYKDIYEKKYLRNWSLLLSSMLCIAFIGIIYKKPGV